MEMRRQKRLLILEKYKIGDTSGSVTPAQASSPIDDMEQAAEMAATAPVVDLAPHSVEQDGTSAADYDPPADDWRNKRVTASSFNELDIAERDRKVLIPAIEEEDVEDDMFASPSAAPAKPAQTMDAVPIAEARKLEESMLDNWDDSEGYYNFIAGELLDERYIVRSNLGRGMFSSVVRADDTKDKRGTVAIKIVRNSEMMYKAGMKEIAVLEQLAQADPDDRKHVVRLLRHFVHKNHLCIVFESLNINLREVLKRFGRDVGINLTAVRAYAQQIFLGLSLLRKCNILHADVKPDNILVNDARNLLKICDLGSASSSTENNEITPYLVSRFYRAPELILGLSYDYAIDTWSVGCTLFELYTGKILFPGRSNNQMLRLIMECRGKFPHRMIKKGQFYPNHFDEQLVFLSVERDKLSGKDTVKHLNINHPIRDLRSRLGVASSPSEAKLLQSFADFLSGCLEINPERRITPAEAFKHPFLSTR